jgi:hypothetical protein
MIVKKLKKIVTGRDKRGSKWCRERLRKNRYKKGNT